MRHRWILPLAVLPLSLSIAQSPSPHDEIGVDKLLHWLTDFDRLPYLRSWKCFQFSSYDRTGGNADAGNFLRREGDVAVLAEIQAVSSSPNCCACFEGVSTSPMSYQW